MPDFIPFPSIARLSREVVVTEKLDGTNAQVHITEEGEFLTGSRTRWITPTDDNFGFSRWAHEHKDELMQLGPGSHFGEWWGQGIQRKYGLDEKRFSLFNTGRWVSKHGYECRLLDKQEWAPECCHVVPVLATGVFDSKEIDEQLDILATIGSYAAPGFKQPEGIVVYHVHARQLFKKTLDKNDGHKGSK